MKVEVTSTSSSLWGLLSKSQRERFVRNRSSAEVYNVFIQNRGEDDVYFDIGETASTNDSPSLGAGIAMNIHLQDLDKLNLVTDTTADIHLAVSTFKNTTP